MSLNVCMYVYCVHVYVCVSDWMKVEQRVEPAKKAAQVLHKKLQGCMQSQPGLEAEKRMVLKLLGQKEKKQTFDLLVAGVTSASVSTEKAAPDAAVH